MHTLQFRAVVQTGYRKHSRLGIPGRNDLPAAPPDWPIQLEPGSLNAVIKVNGHPDQSKSLGSLVDIRRLAEGILRPEFMIPGASIRRNKKGDGQVWRARLRVLSSGREIDCWVFRRIGSNGERQIELVSEVHLRTTLGICDGTEVIVTVFEGSSDQSDGVPARSLDRGLPSPAECSIPR